MIDKALIMAGGKGSRLGFVEKALIKFNGKYMLEISYKILKKHFRNVYISVSKNVPKTIRYCVERNYDMIYTSGENYVDDLISCLKILGTPIFVTAVDVPMNDDIVIKLLDAYRIWKDYDIITATFKGKPIGVSVFKRIKGRYKNYETNSIFDIDTYSDLKNYERLGFIVEI